MLPAALPNPRMQHRPSIPLTGHQRSHGLTVVLLEEALSLNREMGNEREATPALPPLAEETRSQGGHAGAARLNQETLNRRTDETWRPSALDGMASVVAAREEEEQAARLFGAADATRQGCDVHDGPDIRAGQNQTRDAVRANMRAKGFAAAWATSAALIPHWHPSRP